MKEFVQRSASFPFRRFIGDVRREFMERASVGLHDAWCSCLRDALLHEGGAIAVVRLLAPWA
jgi:hypothetical protein